MGKDYEFYRLLDEVVLKGVDHFKDYDDRALNSLLFVAIHCLETYLSYVQPSK